MDNHTHLRPLTETLKQFSDNEEFKKITELICSNVADINNIEQTKQNEDTTNLLNMYLLDENGNNVCDILNKINQNLELIVKSLSVST
tara:strand:+ start:3098 stop:3361 length:264 start_codon:yes stop_codon:yes gene_type:complete